MVDEILEKMHNFFELNPNFLIYAHWVAQTDGLNRLVHANLTDASSHLIYRQPQWLVFPWRHSRIAQHQFWSRKTTLLSNWTTSSPALPARTKLQRKGLSGSEE